MRIQRYDVKGCDVKPVDPILILFHVFGYKTVHSALIFEKGNATEFEKFPVENENSDCNAIFSLNKEFDYDSLSPSTLSLTRNQRRIAFDFNATGAGLLAKNILRSVLNGNNENHRYDCGKYIIQEKRCMFQQKYGLIRSFC